MTYYPYRRRSIFGGLVLILIGVIFLVGEYHPELDFWGLFYKYWPLLLILFGLAKLFDHIMATRTGEAGPPAITGGEVALILLLLFALGGLAGVHWVSRQYPDIDIGMDNVFTHPYDWTNVLPTIPAKPGEAISISTVRGDISVHPASDGQLHVTVHKTASASSESEAQKRAGDVTVQVTPTGGGYEIQPQFSGGNGSHVRVDLDVQLPSKANITALSDHGDITVAQMEGPVSITSRSGDLEIHDVTGDVNAQMSHGDAHIHDIKGNVRLDGTGSELDLSNISGDATINGEFYGPIRAQNIGRTIHYTSSRTNLTIPKLPGKLEMDSDNFTLSGLTGSLQLATSNKDITLNNVAGRLELSDRHGDIQANFSQPPHDEIDITNESANIDLTLPSQSSFTISAISRSGDINSDFAGPNLKQSSQGDTGILQGTYGSNGPRITLKTTYGTISIHKSSQPEAYLLSSTAKVK